MAHPKMKPTAKSRAKAKSKPKKARAKPSRPTKKSEKASEDLAGSRVIVNAYSTLRTLPPLDFPHQLRARRDRSDPELAEHLDGFAGFVLRDRPMTQLRYATLRHIQRVRHHLALDIDDDATDAFAAWASAANAIVFTPDGAVRAPDGSVLVDPSDGEPEEGADVPYPADAVSRKAATDARLAQLGIRVPPTLPPVLGDGEVELRAVADIAARADALFACAVRAESLAHGLGLTRKELAAIPRGAMSPNERAFFDAAKPAKQDVVDRLWGYEALAVIAWTLGRIRELAFPTAIVDVAGLAKAMRAAHADHLREPRRVLDALDLTFRLHWATTEARIRKTAPPGGLDPGVVLERHRALAWLVGTEDWDDVSTDT